ncbi:diguanylate cyclase [Pseudoalteromonas phenolica]|uniref:diguanylate cyclase n=1 Tax=Pseudoalteromonas phenolica TaxID=161398 RepID=UPI00110AE678|nr:diguanylate cyclase [Pseudoalteromonas phenolica]TMO56441.1 hypothetical protein CWC21_07010 [Pseudoalteromonas phenolica]
MQNKKTNLASQNLCNDLYSRSKIGPLFYVLSTLITGFLADYYASLSMPFIAAMFVLVITAIARLMARPPQNTKDSRDAFIKKHWLLVFCCVVTWSIFFSWTVYELGLSSAFIFGLVSTINFSTAIAHQFSPHLKRALFCSLLCLLPTLVVIILFQPSLHVAALALALYIPYLLLTAKNSHKEYFEHLNNKLQLEAALLEVELLSITDGLTGLYNRREFNNQLGRAFATSNRTKQAVSLILCDIDDFKKINGSYSHTAGDDCLIHVAKVLKNVFSRETDIIARVGGEEFAIIVLSDSENSAMKSAENFQQLLSASVCSTQGHEISLTASIGVVCYQAQTSIKPHQLYDLADSAMYRAKNKGKNRVEYTTL